MTKSDWHNKLYCNRTQLRVVVFNKTWHQNDLIWKSFTLQMFLSECVFQDEKQQTQVSTLLMYSAEASLSERDSEKIREVLHESVSKHSSLDIPFNIAHVNSSICLPFIEAPIQQQDCQILAFHPSWNSSHATC